MCDTCGCKGAEGFDAERGKNYRGKSVNYELIPSVEIEGVGIVSEGSPYLKNNYDVKWDDYDLYDDDAGEVILSIPTNHPRMPLQEGELKLIEAMVYGFNHPLADASWGELNERGMFWAAKTMEELANYDPYEAEEIEEVIKLNKSKQIYQQLDDFLSQFKTIRIKGSPYIVFKDWGNYYEVYPLNDFIRMLNAFTLTKHWENDELMEGYAPQKIVQKEGRGGNRKMRFYDMKVGGWVEEDAWNYDAEGFDAENLSFKEKVEKMIDIASPKFEGIKGLGKKIGAKQGKKLDYKIQGILPKAKGVSSYRRNIETPKWYKGIQLGIMTGLAGFITYKLATETPKEE